MEATVRKGRISKSEFVRRAIEQTLARDKAAAKLSAYDVMKDGCGIVRVGPADLATNPAHQKDFGRD
jgi:hypothetical protein